MLTGGKLYLSPIREPQRVLDLGTGTGILFNPYFEKLKTNLGVGIWAIDFAEYVAEYSDGFS